MSGIISCHIASDLRHELTVHAGRELAREIGNTERPGFPGVLLTINGGLMAMMGFGRESGRTLAITDPIFTTPQSAELRLALFSCLLDEVSAEAARLGCRFIRSMQSADASEAEQWILHGLENGRFLVRATVVRWRIRTVFHSIQATGLPSSLQVNFERHPKQTEVRQLSACDLHDNPEEYQGLKILLQRILEDSRDLPQLPTPSADELLNEWIAEDAEILLAEEVGTAVALCACVSEPLSAEVSSSCFRIQYIGVRPDLRRLGIAGRLLNLVPVTLGQVKRGSNDIDACLIAYADKDNEQASSLYRRCGFQPTNSFNIWLREILYTGNAKEPS